MDIMIFLVIYLGIGGVIIGFYYDPKDPKKNEEMAEILVPILLLWPVGITIKIGSWLRKQIKGQ